MPIDPTINTGQVTTGQNIQSDGTTAPQQSGVSTPQATGGDISGASTASYSSSSPVFMEQPKLDQASMMLLMTKLQSKLADQQATLANEDIKGTRKDMKDMHEKRIAKMQEYWDKMAKSSKGGFFGKLFSAIKKVFSGDLKGALDDIGKAFSEDIVTAIVSIAVMAFCCATMGPLGPLVAAAVLTPWMMGDAELMGQFADIMGLEGKAKEDFVQAMHWIGFALEIIVDIAIAVAVSVATLGAATPAMVAFLTAKATVIAARETERGVKSYQATKANSEGLEAYAEADILQAQANERQVEINKMMERLKDNYDSFSKVIGDSAQMLRKNYQAQQAAATSV